MFQGDCLKSLSLTGFRHSENALCLTWRTQTFSKFASLGCATGDTAMILVPRATHAQPGHNATHQHHSTPAPQHNQQQETNNNHSFKHQHRHQHHHHNTNHQQPTTTNNKCTATRTGTTPATAATATNSATTPTTVPSSCAPHRTLSRIDARACAQNKGHRQQQQQLQRKITSHGIKQHGNSVAASSDSGSALLRFLVSNSKTHARHAKNAVVHQ